MYAQFHSSMRIFLCNQKAQRTLMNRIERSQHQIVKKMKPDFIPRGDITFFLDCLNFMKLIVQLFLAAVIQHKAIHFLTGLNILSDEKIWCYLELSSHQIHHHLSLLMSAQIKTK